MFWLCWKGKHQQEELKELLLYESCFVGELAAVPLSVGQAICISGRWSNTLGKILQSSWILLKDFFQGWDLFWLEFLILLLFFLHSRSHGGPYFFGEDSRKGNLEVALSGDLLSGIVLLVSTSYSWRGRLCVLRPALENTYSLWWMILYFKAGAC